MRAVPSSLNRADAAATALSLPSVGETDVPSEGTKEIEMNAASEEERLFSSPSCLTRLNVELLSPFFYFCYRNGSRSCLTRAGNGAQV